MKELKIYFNEKVRVHSSATKQQTKRGEWKMENGKKKKKEKKIFLIF